MYRAAGFFLIAGASLAALASSVLPDKSAEPTAPPGAVADATVEAAPPAQAQARRSGGYREASLTADSRGQYTVEALVNGMPVRMLVDTGASVVAVSAGTAARLGLAVRPAGQWTIRTGNGTTTASPVTLDHVSFGGLFMNDVRAVVLPPRAGEVNLLGASFLKRLLSVEQRDGVLVLRQ